MLLSQQAQLLRLDERRAVVRVAGTWMAMVQSRLPLLEKAVASALGSPRQLSLEAGGDTPSAQPSSAQTPPARPTAVADPPRALDGPPVSPSPRPTGATAAPAAAGISAARTSIASPPGADRHPRPAAPPPSESGERIDEPRTAAVAMPAAIDAQASRLAEFFNGEVISGLNGDTESI
jgi:DNA polymerase-3 subunit gamma/tau